MEAKVIYHIVIKGRAFVIDAISDLYNYNFLACAP